jgi:hypothetical protein
MVKSISEDPTEKITKVTPPLGAGSVDRKNAGLLILAPRSGQSDGGELRRRKLVDQFVSVLFVGHDSSILTQQSKHAVARTPNAKLEEFPDTGHTPQISEPGELSQSIPERSLSVAFRGPEMNCPIDGRFLNDSTNVTLRYCEIELSSDLRIQNIGFATGNAHLLNFLIVSNADVRNTSAATGVNLGTLRGR